MKKLSLMIAFIAFSQLLFAAEAKLDNSKQFHQDMRNKNSKPVFGKDAQDALREKKMLKQKTLNYIQEYVSRYYYHPSVLSVPNQCSFSLKATNNPNIVEINLSANGSSIDGKSHMHSLHEMSGRFNIGKLFNQIAELQDLEAREIVTVSDVSQIRVGAGGSKLIPAKVTMSVATNNLKQVVAFLEVSAEFSLGKGKSQKIECASMDSGIAFK